MFSPGLDKSCVRPESCSPGRNASTRFPVGIPPLGDENQQINRIQLAVQKYNNTSSIPVNNRSGFLSPVRHCLLKNTLRSKNYETEEGFIKNEKKSGNYYEGVGAFPTIHLRKSAIRYRPIRRFHDVKVPYPELPVNRYLSHLPELCTDLKSSTRSVLDVLQDLSAKKIQEEDDGSNKTKSKGLAGDYIMDPNAVYKPLFVQKPKMNSVTTRDSMTQTLSPFRSDTPSPQICNLNSRNDVSDPKAELRKKLAKQNNEISASLSSSITSSFAIKRKIDKVLTAKDDDQSPELSAVKKTRIDHTNQTENGFVNSTNNKNEPVKFNRKLKLMETSSPPPNKDRLTTIFLDTRNTSPKSKIFQDSDMPKSNGISNGFASNSPTVNGSIEDVKTPKHNAGESSKTDSGKQENEQSKLVFSSPLNKSDNPSPKPSMPICQFGLPNTNFNFKPAGSSLVPSKDAPDASQISVNHSASNDKKEEGPKTFSFGSNEANISGFKFGSDSTKSPVKQKTETSEVATTTPPVTTPPQVTFSVKSSDTISPAPQPSIQGSFITPGQSLFTFGQNGSSSGEASKTATSPTTVSAPSSSQNVQSAIFTFSQKSSTESPSVQANIQTTVTTSTPSTTQAPSGQNSVALSSTAPTGGLFSFGQKVETDSKAALATSTAVQKPQFTFTFGQKAEPPKLTESGPKNVFTFAQKETPEATQANGVTTSDQTPASPPTSTFGQTGVAQSGVLFGATTFGSFKTPTTNSSSAPSATQSTFGVSTTQSTPTFSVPTTQSTPMFGVSTTQSTPAFGVATVSSSVYGASTTTSTFGASTTTTPAFVASVTTTPAFGASTTTTPAFGASTTTAPAFGASTTTTPAFGASTTTTPAFGASTTTTPAFGASTTTTPAFGASTTTTPAFGVLSTQPTFKFGASTTQTTNFGVSSSNHDVSTSTTTTTTQSAPVFGLNTSKPAFSASTSAQPTQVFGTAATQSAPAFGVSSSTPAFGTSTTSASVSAFGTTTSASTPMFGASSSALTLPSFGTPTTQNAFGAPTAQTTPAFGASTSQSIPAFGTSSTPAFGASSTIQSTSSFGSSTATSTPAFGAPVSNGFGASSQPNSIFGAPASTQSGFGVTTNTSVFGTSGGFGATSSQSNTVFGTSGGTQTTSAFGAQPFGKPSAPSIFGQNTATPAFSSGSNFGATQSSIFGAKPNEKEMFGQNKMFGSQNNFQFGSTANSTGFTTSPPTTAAAPVFSFGSGGGATNTFSFSANSSAGSSNTQTPFAFTPNEPFKFGATNSKENTGFGVGPSPNFNFGSQMNSAASNPAFDFRQTQNNAASGFNFSAGSSSSPSVFSFGGSGSSSSNSNRGFNFGTPTPGASFGQSTPTFGVPGTFNIGSGSSQSRPRAASRLRRRP